MAEERRVATPHGPARVVVRRARRPVAALVLSHGAGRGIDAPDLLEVARSLPTHSVTTYLVEQPWVARGRRVADRAAVLDECLVLAVNSMRMRTPLFLGGRSAGARSSVRLAHRLGAVGCVAMAFPLHPPGRPERSRASELVSARVPTLVIQGERDAMGRPGEFPPGTDLRIVPGADHGYQVLRSGPLPQDQVYRLVARAARDWIRAQVGAV